MWKKHTSSNTISMHISDAFKQNLFVAIILCNMDTIIYQALTYDRFMVQDGWKLSFMACWCTNFKLSTIQRFALIRNQVYFFCLGGFQFEHHHFSRIVSLDSTILDGTKSFFVVLFINYYYVEIRSILTNDQDRISYIYSTFVSYSCVCIRKKKY